MEDEMGMSDFQFKAFLKQLSRRLESAQKEEDPEQAREKLAEVIRDLKSDYEN